MMRKLNHFRLVGHAFAVDRAGTACVPLLKMETGLFGVKADRAQTTIEAKL
jgi:hypothetical protein